MNNDTNTIESITFQIVCYMTVSNGTICCRNGTKISVRGEIIPRVGFTTRSQKEMVK